VERTDESQWQLNVQQYFDKKNHAKLLTKLLRNTKENKQENSAFLHAEIKKIKENKLH